MGAGRLPEQIGDRAEAGRRAMLEDQTPDPLIEKLKATPVERKIVPEEQNRRRAISSKAGRGKGAKAKAKASALRSALQEVWTLRAEIARMSPTSSLACSQPDLNPKRRTARRGRHRHGAQRLILLHHQHGLAPRRKPWIARLVRVAASANSPQAFAISLCPT